MYRLRDFLNCKYTSKYEIKYDRLIGYGNHSMVYEACSRDDCNYIAKVSRLDTNGPIAMLDEVKFQNRAADIGIAPRVLDHFIRGGKDHIIMERINGETFEQFAMRASDQDRKVVCGRIVNTITKLNSFKVLHRDLHERNIMITRDSWQTMLIDFAWATEGNGEKLDDYGLQLYRKCDPYKL